MSEQPLDLRSLADIDSPDVDTIDGFNVFNEHAKMLTWHDLSSSDVDSVRIVRKVDSKVPPQESVT